MHWESLSLKYDSKIIYNSSVIWLYSNLMSLSTHFPIPSFSCLVNICLQTKQSLPFFCQFKLDTWTLAAAASLTSICTDFFAICVLVHFLYQVFHQQTCSNFNSHKKYAVHNSLILAHKLAGNHQQLHERKYNIITTANRWAPWPKEH